MMRVVEIRTFIAYAVKVVLSRCSVITASNDGAQFLRDPSFRFLELIVPKIVKFDGLSTPVFVS